jgi:hypothetical protein
MAGPALCHQAVPASTEMLVFRVIPATALTVTPSLSNEGADCTRGRRFPMVERNRLLSRDPAPLSNSSDFRSIRRGLGTRRRLVPKSRVPPGLPATSCGISARWIVV